MTKQRRSFTQELKREAASLALNQGYEDAVPVTPALLWPPRHLA